MLQLLKLNGRMDFYEYTMQTERQQGVMGIDAEEYQ